MIDEDAAVNRSTEFGFVFLQMCSLECLQSKLVSKDVSLEARRRLCAERHCKLCSCGVGSGSANTEHCKPWVGGVSASIPYAISVTGRCRPDSVSTNLGNGLSRGWDYVQLDGEY